MDSRPAMCEAEWAELDKLRDELRIAAGINAQMISERDTARDRIRELEEELDSTVRLLDAANVDNDRLREEIAAHRREILLDGESKFDVNEADERLWKLAAASDEQEVTDDRDD